MSVVIGMFCKNFLNFGGGLLTGTRSACAAACEAFREAVAAIAHRPIEL